MNRLGTGVLFLLAVLWGHPALAQPSPAPSFTWTGLYVGGSVGYSWGNSDTSQTITGGGRSFSATDTINLDGLLGGPQVGYNWLINNIWLLGIEADFQWTGEDGDTSAFCPAAQCGAINTFSTGTITTRLSEKLNWFGTVRGRLGILVQPSWLVYATGGFAYGRISWNATLNGTEGTVGAPRSAAFSGQENQTGWAAGGGIDVMLAENWILRIEYLHIDLGSISAGPLATPIHMGAIPGRASWSFNSDVTDDIVRVVVNYRIWGPSSGH